MQFSRWNTQEALRLRSNPCPATKTQKFRRARSILDSNNMTWLKQNWFKATIITSLLIAVAAVSHYYLVSLPDYQKAQIQLKEAEQRIQEQKDQDAKMELEKKEQQRQDSLATCISNVESRYSDNWHRECKARGLLSKICIDIKELEYKEYLEKYNLTEEEYKKQRNIKDDNTFSGLLDYIKRAEECSCMLPLAIADRLDDGLKEDKDRCSRDY